MKALIRRTFVHPYVLFILPALPYILLRLYAEQLPLVAFRLLFFSSFLVPLGAIVFGAVMASSESSDIRRGGLVVRFSGLALLVCVTSLDLMRQHSESNDNLLLLFVIFTAGYALKAYEHFERKEKDNDFPPK